MKKFAMFLALALLPLLWVACDKGENDDPATPAVGIEKFGTGGAVTVFQSFPNTDPQTGTEFMKQVDSIPCPKVSGADGLPATYGMTPSFYKSWVFSMPSFMDASNSVIRRFDYADGKLTEGGSLQVDPMASPMLVRVLNEQKAYCSLWAMGRILVFNPTTMERITEIDLSALAQSGGATPQEMVSVCPGAMHIRDGILYVGLNQMVLAQKMPANAIAEVALIDTKTDQLIKKITDDTHAFAFAGRPLDAHAFVEDGNGDLYISCVGAFGMNPQMKSGYLRIKKGEQEFDKDYVFQITDAAVPGYAHKLDYVLMHCDLGGGRVFANIWVRDLNTSGPAGMMSDLASVLFEVDLPNKTIKPVEGALPSNARCGASALLEGGDYLVPAYTEQGKGFYLYRAESAKVLPNPVIPTDGYPTHVHDFRK